MAEKGVSSLLSPWQAGSEGRARNDVRKQKILMLAHAKTDAADIRAGRKQLLPVSTLSLMPPPQKDIVENDECIEPTLTLSDAMEYGKKAGPLLRHAPKLMQQKLFFCCRATRLRHSDLADARC